MRDRELLELAAKVAGVQGQFVERYPEDGYPSYSCGISRGVYVHLWNPLVDDGDAMRLAVKLQVCIRYTELDVVCYSPLIHNVEWSHREPLVPDAFSATRRAIVHAAVELGRSTTEPEMCSCGARQKHKCAVENGSNGSSGKLCVASSRHIQ